MDGTLLDSMSLWVSLKRNMCEAYTKRTGKVVDENIIPREKLEAMSTARAVEYIKEVTGHQLDLERDVHALMLEYYLTKSTPKPNVKKFLELLLADGYRLFVATATPEKLARAALEKNEILGFFEKIYTPENFVGGKSKPEFFEYLASDNGVSPEDCAIIDDAIYSLATAREAGFRTVGIYDEIRGDDIFPTADIAFRDYDEMLKYYRENHSL